MSTDSRTAYTTITPDDYEWVAGARAKPCACGSPECLMCLTESLMGPEVVDQAEEDRMFEHASTEVEP